MRPATARRLLVFAVCAVGVSALYWVPSVAGTPGRVSTDPPPEPGPLPRPAATATEPDVASPTGVRSGVQPAPPGPTETATRWRQPEPVEASLAPANDARVDTVPPDTVADVRVVATTRDTLTLRWDETDDDTGVVAYQVWLSGYQVASTSNLRATVDWFNNDSPVTTVQVSAFDAAGNQGLPSSTVLAERPPADPMPSPTTSATPSPSGSTTPEEDEATPAPSATTSTPERLLDETPEPRRSPR
jgi:hypothetical protein